MKKLNVKTIGVAAAAAALLALAGCGCDRDTAALPQESLTTYRAVLRPRRRPPARCCSA